MGKTRVYISGPITGIKGAAKIFRAAEKQLRAEGYETVNPYEVNCSLPPSTTHKEYMKISFDLMDMCKRVFFLDGWQHSPGARLEFIKALNEGKEVKFQTPTEVVVHPSENGFLFQAFVSRKADNETD